jgi:hypothetical protein
MGHIYARATSLNVSTLFSSSCVQALRRRRRVNAGTTNRHLPVADPQWKRTMALDAAHEIQYVQILF